MRGGDKPRRSWGQRGVIGLLVAALLGATGTAGTLALANRTVGDIDRVPVSGVTRDEELVAGDPVNFLIVGIDDASGLAADDPARNRSAADLAGQHTDSIMLLRLDPKAGTAQVLSFPRDLWIPISGTDGSARINSALPTGGASRLIQTVQDVFGIPVHHFAQVDFAGFGGLVEAVDGVPVYFPHPVRAGDETVELDIPTAGCWTLGPRQALGFSRARYDYDVQDAAGEWHRDPGSDFSRVHRQQLLMQLAIQRAFSKGARSPGTIRRLVGLGIDTVAVDDALEPGDMVDLGLQFRNFAPSALQTFTLPVTDGYVGDAQILYLQEERAEPILAVFRGDGSVPAAGLATADVTVQVLNGTGTEGQGSEVTDVLTQAGFATVVADNTPDAPATTVRYAAGAEAMAHLVARYVSGPVRYEVADDLDDVDVVLVTGADWEGAVPAARPADAVPAPTTTTTTTTTTAPDAPTSTTEVAPVETVPDAPTGDPDDPFFKALPPPPGADCPVTE